MITSQKTYVVHLVSIELVQDPVPPLGIGQSFQGLSLLHPLQDHPLPTPVKFSMGFPIDFSQRQSCQASKLISIPEVCGRRER